MEEVEEKPLGPNSNLTNNTSGLFYSSPSQDEIKANQVLKEGRRIVD